jgi:hypothetical protein
MPPASGEVAPAGVSDTKDRRAVPTEAPPRPGAVRPLVGPRVVARGWRQRLPWRAEREGRAPARGGRYIRAGG